jgi:RimJ/RimL family protein N-acetyltransferase
VYLHTLEWNTRARKSFAKSGFREVKEVRRGGFDFVLMEVRREDWVRRLNAANDGASGPTA